MLNMIETNQNKMSKVILGYIIGCMEYFHIPRILYRINLLAIN